MFRILKFRRAYINLRIESSSTTFTRVYERPGLWMSEDEKKTLLSDLETVVETLKVGRLDYGVLSGNGETLNQVVITLIYDKATGRPFAFNALTLMSCIIRGRPETVIHLGLVVVDPNYRAKGLSWVLYGLTTFLLFFKNCFQPVWVSNVTQVPSVLGNVAEAFGNVFPNPIEKTRRSYDHLILAREIETKHRAVFGVGPEAEFDEENFVLKNSYTGGSDNLKKTFEQTAKHRNDIFNNFCKDQLDYSRGDDFLQIGQMTIKTYYQYMIHSIPKDSILTILYKMIFTLIEVSLIPVIQWFTPDQRMGVLRSRKGKNQ